jgi:hypothetical protein
MPQNISTLSERLHAAEQASAQAATEQDQAEQGLSAASKLYTAQPTEAHGAELLGARNALDLAGVRLAAAQSAEDAARTTHQLARAEVDAARAAEDRARSLATLDAFREQIGRAAFVRDAQPIAARIAALESELSAEVASFGVLVQNQAEAHAQAAPLAAMLGEDAAPPIGEDAAERLARTLVYQAITTARPLARGSKDWPCQGATFEPWRGGKRAAAFWIDAPADLEGAYRFGLLAHAGERVPHGTDAALFGSVTWRGNFDDYMPGVPLADKLDALIEQGTIAPLRASAERLTAAEQVRQAGALACVFERSSRAANVARRHNLTAEERSLVARWVAEGEAAQLARSIAWERAKTLGYGAPNQAGELAQVGAIPQDLEARRRAPGLLAFWAWYHNQAGIPVPNAAEMSRFVGEHRASDLPAEHRGTTLLARLEAEKAERRRTIERPAARAI